LDPTVTYLVILAAAFALLITEKLRNDVVAVLIILALAATGLLEPKEALAGFSSEPAIVAASIFVLSAGLHQTGLAETIGGWIGRLAGNSLSRSIAVIMPSVALLSAFTHHLTTTAMMLPVTLDLCRERGLPPSKLLMPLSFATSLGTAITIIGAPAFILASGALQQAGRPGLGIFSLAPIGLAISAAGTRFLLLAGRLLLPDRGGGQDAAEHFRLDRYFTELAIPPRLDVPGQDGRRRRRGSALPLRGGRARPGRRGAAGAVRTGRPARARRPARAGRAGRDPRLPAGTGRRATAGRAVRSRGRRAGAAIAAGGSRRPDRSGERRARPT
jgi:hypothetical protein